MMSDANGRMIDLMLLNAAMGLARQRATSARARLEVSVSRGTPGHGAVEGKGESPTRQTHTPTSESSDGSAP